MNDLQAAQEEIERLRRDLAECEREIALRGVEVLVSITGLLVKLHTLWLNLQKCREIRSKL